MSIPTRLEDSHFASDLRERVGRPCTSFKCPHSQAESFRRPVSMCCAHKFTPSASLTIPERLPACSSAVWLDLVPSLLQKESINIVANLRATNEPLFTVTEVTGDPAAVLSAEEGATAAGGSAGPRIRKISGTLPPGKKFLTPSLSDTSPRPDLKDRPMGFKRKRSLKVRLSAFITSAARVV